VEWPSCAASPTSPISVVLLRFDNEAGEGDHKHVGEREGYPTGSPMWDFAAVGFLGRK